MRWNWSTSDDTIQDNYSSFMAGIKWLKAHSSNERLTAVCHFCESLVLNKPVS